MLTAFFEIGSRELNKELQMKLTTLSVLALTIACTCAAQLMGQQLVLFEGEFDLPFTSAIADVPGWHEPISITGQLPSDLPAISGATLVVALWDASRPDQTCSSQHPLSGCATVDWSDFPTRPRVPKGGVFDNHLFVELADGIGEFFLSETGDLADVPDEFSNS